MAGILRTCVATDVGLQHREVEDAAVEQRRILNLALGDRAAGGTRFGIDCGHGSVDGDLGGGGAGLQFDVDRRNVGGVDLNVVDDLLVEARGFDGHGVNHWLEVGHIVGAGTRGGHLDGLIGANVGNGYFSVGNNRSRGIEDCTCYTAAVCLGGKESRARQEHCGKT